MKIILEVEKQENEKENGEEKQESVETQKKELQ